MHPFYPNLCNWIKHILITIACHFLQHTPPTFIFIKSLLFQPSKILNEPETLILDQFLSN